MSNPTAGKKHGSTVSLGSLARVTREEATRYVAAHGGEELDAAIALAVDRNLLEGTSGEPDDADVHQALYLLRKALGEDAPSFDTMRVELRHRRAA